MGVGDGTDGERGRVVGAAVGVALLVVVAGNAPQPASTDSGPPIPALNVGSSGASTFFLHAEKAIVTKRSESRAMSLAHMGTYAIDGDTPGASKNSQVASGDVRRP